MMIYPVETHNLRRNFGERVALNDVTLSVNEGEIFGLLGPNGGGKTTMFRILSTMLVASAGSARVAGHDVEREPSAVRAAIASGRYTNGGNTTHSIPRPAADCAVARASAAASARVRFIFQLPPTKGVRETRMAMRAA